MKSNKTAVDSERIIEQLRAENELKTKWISLIAHDCRGLFSNIQLLLNALTDNSISQELFVSMLPELKQIAEKNSRTLESTLMWVKSQANGYSPHIQEVLIHDLFAELKEEFETEIIAKELSVKFVGDEAQLLNTDSFLLRFIVKQLIENAIKYANKGGMIEIFTHSDSDKMNITVKDNGVGMNDSRLTAIGTLDGATYTGTMQEKGAGLSLVIVKDFVELLNGEMNVSSILGKGTSVELDFPQG